MKNLEGGNFNDSVERTTKNNRIIYYLICLQEVSRDVNEKFIHRVVMEIINMSQNE